jgi:hypothetical protein
MIGWWPRWDSLSNPGRRLRGELVMRGLRQRGVEVEWFDEHRPERYRCVVIGSRSDASTCDRAQQLRAQGCRLLLDLCDNHLMPPEHNDKLQRRSQRLRELIALVDQVVVASTRLGEVVSRVCPDAPPPQVIGDLADDLSVVPVGAYARLRARISLWRAGVSLPPRGPQAPARLVWFGDQGGDWAPVGLCDIAAMQPLLERLHREFPLHLSVISNNRRKYRRLFARAAFPHRYLEWNAQTFPQLLAQHDIVLIPASDNEFTACKTDNRVVSAFRAGLPVVASPIPSYRRYAAAMEPGDLEAGLRRYLRVPTLRQLHAQRGRALAQHYSAPGPILDLWQQALQPAQLELRLPGYARAG